MNNAASAAHEPKIKSDSRVYFSALGRRLEQLRKSRGYTQAELARAVGVRQQAIFAYELGVRVSVLILDRIATLYGLTIDQVVGRASERRPPANRRLSPRAMRHAERLQGLSETAQRFVIRLIDYLEAIGRTTKR